MILKLVVVDLYAIVLRFWDRGKVMGAPSKEVCIGGKTLTIDLYKNIKERISSILKEKRFVIGDHTPIGRRHSKETIPSILN